MEKFLWNIDEWKYTDYQDHTLELRGWLLSEFSDWKCRCLTSDGTTWNARIERFARPDVTERYSEWENVVDPGFSVEISDAWRLSLPESEVSVLLEREEEQIVLFRIPSRELRRRLEESLLVWNIDAQDLSYGTLLTVRGWAFCQKPAEVHVRLLDEEGNEVPANRTLSRRPDVAAELHLPDFLSKTKMGFTFTLDIQNCRARKLRLTVTALLSGEDCEDGSGGEKVLSVVRQVDVDGLIREDSVWHKRIQELSWKNRGRNLEIFRAHGPVGLWRFIEEKAGGGGDDYESWRRPRISTRTQLRRQRKEKQIQNLKFSIVVPVYNTPVVFLRALIQSVKRQSYQNWELILADAGETPAVQEEIAGNWSREKRVKYKKLPENRGISENTNAAVRQAVGDIILFADHDDELEPDALYWIAHAFHDQKADIVYTDEDKISADGKHLFGPHFKPDFDMIRLCANNYICHIFAVRKSVLSRTGLLRSEFDGAQDHDLILRCCEQTDRIAHIPRALYHWRTHTASTAADLSIKEYALDAGRRAVQEHFRRLGMAAETELSGTRGWFRNRLEIKGAPLVSIIIPTRDHLPDLKKCVNSVLGKSTWQNLEILVVDNGSREPETLQWLKALQKKEDRVRILQWNRPFNYSAVNNFAASGAEGEYFLFLNNDTEVITPSWIEEMLMYAQSPDVGAVGAKLFYPDGTIQHAGVVLGMGGTAGHIYCRGSGEEPGYMGRLISAAQVCAVTAACMLVRRECFERCGGFEERLAVAFNDIDLCMKLRKEGRKIVFTPFAQLIHYESKSRGLEDTPEKQLRFARETEIFRERWKKELAAGDPFYNPNLSLTEGDCRLG